MKRYSIVLILAAAPVLAVSARAIADPAPRIDRAKLFTMLDTNNDGNLSRDEFMKLAELGRGKLKGQPETVGELFGRLDADKDGSLTHEEFSKQVAPRDRSRPSPSETPTSAPASDGAASKHKPGPFRVQTVAELVLRDEKRQKDLPLRVSYPDGNGPFPVIVWSHGMFGSKDGYLPLTEFWAGHGYIVIQPTHSDSLSVRFSQSCSRE